MGRLVLAILVALSMLAAPVAGPAAAHGMAGMAGDCPVHAAAAVHHAGDGTGHRRHAPPPKPAAIAACCLLVSLGGPADGSAPVARHPGRVAVPAFADDVAQGRTVEPAEPPPRGPFLPRA